MQSFLQRLISDCNCSPQIEIYNLQAIRSTVCLYRYQEIGTLVLCTLYRTVHCTVNPSPRAITYSPVCSEVVSLSIQSSTRGHRDIYQRIENESNKDLRTIWWVKYHFLKLFSSLCFTMFYILFPSSSQASSVWYLYFQDPLSSPIPCSSRYRFRIINNEILVIKAKHKGSHRFSHRKHSWCLTLGEENSGYWR